jgi:hypothetical protein
MQNERQAVAGVFDTWASAQAAIDALIGAGFQPDDLSFLALHDDAVRGGSAAREAHIDEDATRGAVARRHRYSRQVCGAERLRPLFSATPEIGVL